MYKNGPNILKNPIDLNTVNGTHYNNKSFTCVNVNRARCPNENTSRDGPYLWLSLRASGGMYTVVPGVLVSVCAS